jgi:hypothetical protein
VGDTFAASAFANNFIKGFSFVDEYQRSKRNEQRLEERLAQEAEERRFQRKRTLEADAQVRETRQLAKEDRLRGIDHEDKRIEGDRLAASGASNEELMVFAPFSPAAAALIKKRTNQAEVNSALSTAMGIGASPATQQQSNQATQSQSSQGPTANAAGMPTMTPQERRAHAQLIAEDTGQAPSGGAGFQFADSRAPQDVPLVSGADQRKFDQDFQDKNIAERGLDRIGGFFGRAGRAVGELFDVEGAINRSEIDPDVGLVGAAVDQAGETFSGGARIPGFVSSEEFDQITDPVQRQRVAESNDALIKLSKKNAQKPGAGTLSVSRQGQTVAGGREAQNAAIRDAAVTTATYDDYLTNATSEFSELAATEPSVARARYFNDRSTLASTWGDSAEGRQKLAELDRRMTGVVQRDLNDQIEVLRNIPQANKVALRRQQQLVDNTKSSMNEIAKVQKSIASEAGVDRRGLPLNNTELTQAVIDVMNDPQRPNPAYVDPRQLNAAMTVAGGINENTRRINSKQINALAVLASAGYISKSTAFTVMRTGQWPRGEGPKDFMKTLKSGDTTYALYRDGSMAVLPDVVGDRKRTKEEREAQRGQQTMSPEAISDAQAGARAAGMPERDLRGMEAFMIEHADYIRENFNIADYESRHKMGQVYYQALTLSDKKRWEMDSDFDFFNIRSNPKNAPTTAEIFRNQKMRDELANHFEVELVKMPTIGRTDGLDLVPFRRALADGVHGPRLQALESQMTDDQVAYVYALQNASPEQLEQLRAQWEAEQGQ